MPKYRVLAKSLINNTIVNEGDIVDYDGRPGANLEPYEPARKAKGKAENTANAEPFEDHLT